MNRTEAGLLLIIICLLLLLLGILWGIAFKHQDKPKPTDKVRCVITMRTTGDTPFIIEGVGTAVK